MATIVVVALADQPPPSNHDTPVASPSPLCRFIGEGLEERSKRLSGRTGIKWNHGRLLFHDDIHPYEWVVWSIDGGDEGCTRDVRLDVVCFGVRKSMPTGRQNWFENGDVGVVDVRPRDEGQVAVEELGSILVVSFVVACIGSRMIRGKEARK